MSSRKPTVLRSFAKINLGLRIGPPRADGFHELSTLYQTIALHDTLTVAAEFAPYTTLTLTCSDSRVPCDARNTAWRMVMEALSALGCTATVRIHLQKNLPVQGGMGAGSANAAGALLGLERQLGLALAPVERQRIAASIGSDVPLFLLGGTVYGHHRGEVVLPYPDLPRTHAVIAVPAVGSSTPAAFRAWDGRIETVTVDVANTRLNELSRVYASAFTPAGSAGPPPPRNPPGAPGQPGSHVGDPAGSPLLALVRTGIDNDFESVVFQQHPSLRELKQALLGEGIASSALVAMLSGSGSSLFGLYRSAQDAAAAQQRVSAVGGGVRTLRTHTVTRDEYWSSMFSA